MDLNLISTNVNRLLTNMDSVIDYASSREYERVIQFSNLPDVTWVKVGELRGISIWHGAHLSFSVKNANRVTYLRREELKVTAVQRGVGGISVKVYSLGEARPLGTAVGYVQLNDFDFDIYVKRGAWNPLSVVGQNSSFNGTFNNFGEVAVEPTGIVYVPTHTILNTDMDTGWIPLTLLNGWIPRSDGWSCPNGVPSYRKLPGNIVEVRGAVTGVALTQYTTVAHLPAGFRPIAGLSVSTFITPGKRVGFDIYPNGSISVGVLEAQTATASSILYANFSFLAEQ